MQKPWLFHSLSFDKCHRSQITMKIQRLLSPGGGGVPCTSTQSSPLLSLPQSHPSEFFGQRGVLPFVEPDINAIIHLVALHVLWIHPHSHVFQLTSSPLCQHTGVLRESQRDTMVLHSLLKQVPREDGDLLPQMTPDDHRLLWAS